MDIQRGLLAAAYSAIAGAAGAAALVVAIAIIFRDGWDVDWQLEVINWQTKAVVPVALAATYFGLASFVNYTPNKKYQYAHTLAIIIVAAQPLIWIACGLGLPRPRYRGVDHPALYPSEYLWIILLPTLVVSTILLLYRVQVSIKPASVHKPGADEHDF